MSRNSFSNYFHLNKRQPELDFVDIPIGYGDIPLFIDPYAISKRNDIWSIDCHNEIVNFFQGVINKIRSGNEETAKYMLSGLKEPNQTRFGLSKGKEPCGRGISGEQKNDLYEALSDSTAVRTGFIQDLEECELLIEGIGRDKISDIATNIIRHKLIEYTQEQCTLWDIKMLEVPSGLIWNAEEERWTNNYTSLPVCNGRSVILVPKVIARFDIEFNHREYYQHFVLDFLQAEHLSANTSLVITLKNGVKRPPYKKTLSELNPLSKRFLYNFSKENPVVLENYKKSKNLYLGEITDEELLLLSSESEKEKFDYISLHSKLDLIPPGNESAGEYHDYIKGALTAIFNPYLVYPKKEQEIHEGRKRIDIVFQNAARSGFFFQLPNNKSIPSGYIFIECKNYSADPSNPELDQLSGRFGVNRGHFGFLVCRCFENKKIFIKRCKDTADDGRGFIIALDDNDIKILLSLKDKKDESGINKFLDERFKELVM